MIESLLQSGIGGLTYASSSSVTLYAVSAVVLSLILAFLATTAYFHYIHWRFSHIPQPERPRLAVTKDIYYIRTGVISVHVTTFSFFLGIYLTFSFYEGVWK